MTDSFEHPDGHHYRFLGFGPEAAEGDGPFYYDDDGSMLKVAKTQFGSTELSSHHAVFERVEPPLWPWTGPSGETYDLGHGGIVFPLSDSPCIDPIDFAGLAERLAKQAALNEGDA